MQEVFHDIAPELRERFESVIFICLCLPRHPHHTHSFLPQLTLSSSITVGSSLIQLAYHNIEMRFPVPITLPDHHHRGGTKYFPREPLKFKVNASPSLFLFDALVKAFAGMIGGKASAVSRGGKGAGDRRMTIVVTDKIHLVMTSGFVTLGCEYLSLYISIYISWLGSALSECRQLFVSFGPRRSCKVGEWMIWILSMRMPLISLRSVIESDDLPQTVQSYQLLYIRRWCQRSSETSTTSLAKYSHVSIHNPTHTHT